MMAGDDETLGQSGSSADKQAMIHKRTAILLAVLTGVALELGIHAISGRREAWDSTEFWTIGLPAAALISVAIGYMSQRSDWLWTIGGIAAVGVSTGVVMVFIVGIAQSAQPAFLSLTPLGADRLWILLVWVPFWLLNILGEEFLWRGVILPRQELAFGQHAWLANAAGWLVFHLACGWAVILLVTPIVFILPWIVQKRRNSSIGIIIHAALNGPAFIAVALGFA